MDMSQYRDLFLAESREHLNRLNEHIQALEQAYDEETINSVFRSAHSLKGMSSSMGYNTIAELAHKMEDLLSRVREGELSYDKGIANLLLEGSDTLDRLLSDVEADRPLPEVKAGLLTRLAEYPPEIATPTPVKVISEPPDPKSTTIPSPSAPPKETFQTVRVRTEILDKLIDTTGELFTTKHRLQDVGRETVSPRLTDAVNDLTRLLRELHQMVMQVRLMPFSSLAERFPRVVRELAQNSGKEVSFQIDGREIELDRGILEEVADPLIHMLRNAVDHGLELPDERTAAGKDRVGKIWLSAWREKDQASIAVEDDGRGMNPERLVASAIKKGLITAEEGARLSPKEAYLLTCLPGFSTAEEVTDISGRGVGMDAVRATIQSLGGSLAIESEVGRGSRIIMRLPLTIAIINVLQVNICGINMAFPVTSVLRTFELRQDQIFNEGRRFFFMGDEDVPLINLNRLIGRPNSEKGEYIPVIVTEIKGRSVGIEVDKVLGQREVHVKPVGRPMNQLRGLSGGAILGDGEIIYIIDPASLF